MVCAVHRPWGLLCIALACVQVREAFRIAWIQTITGAYYQRKSLSEVPTYNPYM